MILEELEQFILEAKAGGKKIIAFMAHEFIPIELIHASGMIPLKIMMNGNDELFAMGKEYMTSSCCSWANSVLGMFESAKSDHKYRIFELTDYYICSNYCNADLFASEIIANKFEKPILRFFVPFKNTAIHVDGFYHELQRFKVELERISGKPIEKEKIWESIKKYNELRFKLLQITSSSLPAKEKLQHIWKAATFGPFYTDLPKDMLFDFSEQNTKPKIVFSGCQPFIDDDIVDLIEECGLEISFFDTWDGSYFSSALVDSELESDGIDPLKVLAETFKKNKGSPHLIENSEIHLEQRLLNHVFDTQSSGVIYYILKFCEVYGNRRDRIKNLLKEKGIPFLALERDFSSSSGQLRTRIEAFKEVITDAKK